MKVGVKVPEQNRPCVYKYEKSTDLRVALQHWLDAARCRRSSVVCLSVLGTLVIRAKTAEPIGRYAVFGC